MIILMLLQTSKIEFDNEQKFIYIYLNKKLDFGFIVIFFSSV